MVTERTMTQADARAWVARNCNAEACSRRAFEADETAVRLASMCRLARIVHAAPGLAEKVLSGLVGRDGYLMVELLERMEKPRES